MKVPRVITPSIDWCKWVAGLVGNYIVDLVTLL